MLYARGMQINLYGDHSPERTTVLIAHLGADLLGQSFLKPAHPEPLSPGLPLPEELIAHQRESESAPLSIHRVEVGTPSQNAAARSGACLSTIGI